MNKFIAFFMGSILKKKLPQQGHIPFIGNFFAT